MSLPTLVLVPGACHPAPCYDLLIPHLHALGFPTKAINLPSLNPSNPSTATCARDAEFVREHALVPLIEEGKEVLLVGHSSAGVPMSAATFGLSIRTRSKDGKKGGVMGLIYIAAFMVKEGQEMMAGRGGQDPPWLRNNTPSPGLMVFENPTELFYNDVQREVAAKFVDSLLPHAYIAFHSPCPAPAWVEDDFKGRFAYIRCMEDPAVPLSMQDSIIKGTGVEWTIRDIAGGHSPFVSRPEELAGILLDLSRTFDEAE